MPKWSEIHWKLIDNGEKCQSIRHCLDGKSIVDDQLCGPKPSTVIKNTPIEILDKSLDDSGEWKKYWTTCASTPEFDDEIQRENAYCLLRSGGELYIADGCRDDDELNLRIRNCRTKEFLPATYDLTDVHMGSGIVAPLTNDEVHLGEFQPAEFPRDTSDRVASFIDGRFGVWGVDSRRSPRQLHYLKAIDHYNLLNPRHDHFSDNLQDMDTVMNRKAHRYINAVPYNALA